MNKKASKLIKRISTTPANYRRLKKIYTMSSWIDKTKIKKGIFEGIEHGKKFMEKIK